MGNSTGANVTQSVVAGSVTVVVSTPTPTVMPTTAPSSSADDMVVIIVAIVVPVVIIILVIIYFYTNPEAMASMKEMTTTLLGAKSSMPVQTEVQMQSVSPAPA